jgi:hypothetical protein
VNGTSKNAGIAAAAVTFFVLAAFMNLQEHGWLAWAKLAVSGEMIPVRITSRNPERHDGCDFEYRINDRRYTGHQPGCQLNVGETAQAVYLPSEPGFAALRPPLWELLFRIFVPIVIAVIAGLVTAWRVPREAPRP